jgi:putative endonuclease
VEVSFQCFIILAKQLMFYTYVLYSKAFDKIYIGFTSDLEHRIAAHNDFRNSGWTKKYRPWELVYHEAVETKSAAMKREKQLKTAKGRLFIRQSIISGI